MSERQLNCVGFPDFVVLQLSKINKHPWHIMGRADKPAPKYLKGQNSEKNGTTIPLMFINCYNLYQRA